MTEQKQTNQMPKMWIRVLVIVLIIGAVFGVWMIRNAQNNQDRGATIADFDYTFDFDLEEILSHNKPVIIQFGAEGCPPCAQMQPDLIDAYLQMKDEAIFVYVDVWKDTQAPAGFPLRVVPTQFFYDSNGQAFMYNEGMMNTRDILNILREMD